MQVTNVNIKLVPNRPRLKALASITLDDGLAINSIKIIQTEKRLCAEFPRRPNTKFEYVAPINKEIRILLESAIMCEYKRLLKTENKH